MPRGRGKKNGRDALGKLGEIKGKQWKPWTTKINTLRWMTRIKRWTIISDRE